MPGFYIPLPVVNINNKINTRINTLLMWGYDTDGPKISISPLPRAGPCLSLVYSAIRCHIIVNKFTTENWMEQLERTRQIKSFSF